MAQVGVAPGVEHLRPAHAEAVILFRYDIEIRDGFVAARPAGFGIEFGCGFEEVRAAADALVYAGLLDVIVCLTANDWVIFRYR